MSTSRVTAAAWLAVLVLAACERREARDAASGAPESGAADTAAVGAATPADTALPSPTAAGALTDANIVALLDEANQADSAAGALAVRERPAYAARRLAPADVARRFPASPASRRCKSTSTAASSGRSLPSRLSSLRARWSSVSRSVPSTYESSTAGWM